MTPLRLRLSASVTPTSAGILLRSDLGTFRLAGPGAAVLVTQLLPLLDGSRERAALAAALPGCSPASVAGLLDLLAARGLVEEVDDEAPGEHRRSQVAFLRRCSRAPAEAMARLASARVLLAGTEPWGEVAAALLGAAGIGALERLGSGGIQRAPSLLVAAVSPEDAGLAERVACVAHGAGARVLWSHLDGSRAVLGPLTVPGRTACRICATAEALNPPLGARPAPGPRTEIAARLLGSLVAMEALKVVSEYTPTRLGGRVLVEDLTTFETRLHTLVRLPWCRVCGTGAAP